ncbi:hypothetical protein HEK616_79130 (plasmid) [Streptomyces nigrescens]|uniref:Uncharacterized protein n=1 Tax=Streptomyces nigrescens TaxID=1920 RepID=A0ABM8A715_STRNI|nr:hypothetical protein HEK616_79130 [Streptomyces nigrescens]
MLGYIRAPWDDSEGKRRAGPAKGRSSWPSIETHTYPPGTPLQAEPAHM